MAATTWARQRAREAIGRLGVADLDRPTFAQVESADDPGIPDPHRTRRRHLAVVVVGAQVPTASEQLVQNLCPDGPCRTSPLTVRRIGTAGIVRWTAHQVPVIAASTSAVSGPVRSFRVSEPTTAPY